MNGKYNQSQHGNTKPDDKPMDGPNPDHTPTDAQSTDNRPTDAPNPENSIIRFCFAMLTQVVFTIHSILFSAIVTVAPFRSVFWVWGISWSVVCAQTQKTDRKGATVTMAENKIE
jgi:hypothetical protein